MKPTTLFTAEQLDALRTEFSKLTTVDPCGEAYPKMIAMLDQCAKETIKQLAGANIKFLSKLALNRVNR